MSGFSIAGKRLGELDKRGLLFYDFYRYVKNQNPKVFIIENVKGLLSDNNGITFQNWIQLLGQSLNKQFSMFTHPDSLLYNLHFTVLNTKDFGLPQNRERVFLIGIRNDLSNEFRFPKGVRLKLRLKDLLEDDVDEKYYLSDKMIECLTNKRDGYEGRFDPDEGYGISSTLTSRYHKMGATDTFIKKIGFINQDTQGSAVYGSEGVSPTISSGTHGYSQGYIEEPHVVAMRGREEPQVLTPKRTEYGKEIRKDYESGKVDEQRKNIQQLEPRTDGLTNTITSVQKDNLIVLPQVGQLDGFESVGRIYSQEGLSPTVTAKSGGGHEPYIEVKEATRKGFCTAVVFEQPSSNTRRGRIGKEIANTIETQCNQGVMIEHRGHLNKEPTVITNGIVPTLRAESHGHETKVIIDPNIKTIGRISDFQNDRIFSDEGISATISAQGGNNGGHAGGVYKTNARIRRLTPLECMRLQGYPDSYIKPCSDTQTYKQAGNSISVPVMKGIIKNLLHILT